MVGYTQGEDPILIQLDGRYDGMQFWTQEEALELLRQQTLEAVSGDVPNAQFEEEPISWKRPAPQTRASFWSRKQSKTPEQRPPPKPVRSPVTVNVELDQASFRTENAYGLFGTLRAQAVVLSIDVR